MDGMYVMYACCGCNTAYSMFTLPVSMLEQCVDNPRVPDQINYMVGQKTCHFTFVHIFTGYWSIFRILSLAHSADNLR